MLSALVDAGIPAEKAGTDLRNIFIKLAKDGRTMDDAFNEVRGSTNQLATAVDMFDQRAAGSAIILAENTEKLGRLKEAYEGAAGSAEQMAKAQLDNLKGDQLLLTSAWEGFVLSVDDGSGVISRGLRLMTQGFTGLLDLLNQINSVSVADSLAAAADAQLKALGGVGNLASDAGKKIVAQYDLIIESIQEYGNTQQDIELIEARRNKIFRDTQALEDAYIKGTLTEKGKAELAVARAAIATIDAEIGKRKAVVESSGVVKIATEVTDKNTEGTERNTAAKGKQAAAIRVLTDELRAFQKAQQDINSGVGIGQMDVVGGIGSQTPIGDPASRLLPGTEIAGNLRDNLAETTELTVDYTNLFMNMSSSIGQALGESFNDVEDANRRIVLSILEMVRNAARMYIAMAMAREVGTKGFIGLGTGIALQVAVEAILAAAINNIKTSGFAEGGMVRQSDGPRYTKNKGDSVLISAAPGEVVMTEEQQRRANRAAGFNIFSAARVPGFAAGGPVGGSVYSFKKGSGMPTAPRPSPAELNATRNAMTMLNTPIYTRITEVNDVQGRVSRIAERGTL